MGFHTKLFSNVFQVNLKSYRVTMCIFWFSLKAMRKGLLDVLPKNSLEDLTAEDFRLLVNGCGEVNVQMLISFTSFNDESGMK